MNALTGYMNGARLAQNIYSSQHIRQFESQAAVASGCTLYDLMERAGLAVFNSLIHNWPLAKRILVVCGGGNNAGDGYVVARLAQDAGISVQLVSDFDRHKASEDAQRARQKWLDSGGAELNLADLDIAGVDVVVDALLGTGLAGVVRKSLHQVIQQINASQLPVLSVDVPSGLDADTGETLGIAIQATLTVTFMGLKFGLVSGMGKNATGTLLLDDLGVQPAFNRLVSKQGLLYQYADLPPLPPRQANAHKGDCGRVLCIGGNKGMPGAIRLSAESALRTGAGLVKVLCHSHSQPFVCSGRPELMLAEISDIESHLRWATAIVIGPGLGQDEWAKALFERVLSYQQQTQKPMVLDADGLNLLCIRPKKLNDKVVITPHPGEAARLLQTTIEQVEHSRLASAKTLAEQFAAFCVLKGAGSVIASASEENSVAVCAGGNPGMATAGMGDVLSGIIGGLMGQQFSLDQCALYGVALHAAAGDLSANKNGQRGLLASDMMPFIRQLINEL